MIKIALGGHRPKIIECKIRSKEEVYGFKRLDTFSDGTSEWRSRA